MCTLVKVDTTLYGILVSTLFHDTHGRFIPGQCPTYGVDFMIIGEMLALHPVQFISMLLRSFGTSYDIPGIDSLIFWHLVLVFQNLVIGLGDGLD